MDRQASVVWTGTLKDGKGSINVPSGVLKDIPYRFASRFESEPGTNPEELIAAAHAACYSMALSGKLTAAGITNGQISTTAVVTLGKTDAGPTVTKSALTTRVSAPGMTADTFAQLAADTKQTCPISRLLNAEITLDAQLIS